MALRGHTLLRSAPPAAQPNRRSDFIPPLSYAVPCVPACGWSACCNRVISVVTGVTRNREDNHACCTTGGCCHPAYPREGGTRNRTEQREAEQSKPPPSTWMGRGEERGRRTEFRAGLEDDCDRSHETWVFGCAMAIVALLLAALALRAIYDFWLRGPSSR